MTNRYYVRIIIDYDWFEEAEDENDAKWKAIERLQDNESISSAVYDYGNVKVVEVKPYESD